MTNNQGAIDNDFDAQEPEVCTSCDRVIEGTVIILHDTQPYCTDCYRDVVTGW